MPMSRRQFLVASGVTGAGALAAGAGVLSYDELHHAARERPLAAGTGVLVVVTLYGGNDGLNTVIPYTDPAYPKARPDLAYPAADVLPLADGLGLNPTMTGLHGLWGGKRLAVVRGVSYPKPDHSHFRSMAIWQTASPDTASTTGWLGRWLDNTGTDPLRAIAIGPTLPPLLAGAKTAGATVPTGQLKVPTGAFATGLHALDTSYADEPPLYARVASSGADLFTVAARLAPVLATAPDRDPGATGQLEGDGGELGAQLDVVAECVAAGVPTRVWSVSLGGFDTHADEKGTQSQLLGQLDTALAAFQKKLAATPHGAGVTTVVYSEFGRRVAANASEGTDHGTAGPVLVLGPKVRGGFYGDQPSLTDLDDGDLKVTTDFRSVYATLLERVVGVEAGSVLGSDEHFPRLAFV
jgi:uncharacterized protein (DUF1501 family)